ncbi:MAG: hypothetical protein GXN96_06135 [Aquificae bacterium]|nr:hypothetical protein [Aquificota bacterium]
MGKREFKPLFWGEEKRETREEVRVYENTEDFLREELERTLELLQEKEEEISRLKKEIDLLKNALEEKERKIEDLTEKVRENDIRESLLKGIRTNVLQEVEKLLRNTQQELESFVRKALEEFLLSLPQEEVLKKHLKEILYELLNLREKIKLYLNPEDYRLIAGELRDLKEELKEEGLELEVVIDENLSRGQFLIKGEHFRVERNPEEFAREVYRCILRNGT